MLWVVSFNLCVGRAPHSPHACSCVLRGLFMCVMCSVMRVRFCCFAGGIFSFMAFSGVGVIEHAPASFEEANLRCMTARTTFLRDIAAHVTWLSTVSGGFL